MMMELTPGRGHAVVIGASVAGLATARVLAERFARVTVLERHARPAGATSVAPQGRYPHVLLEGGGLVAERLFPSFRQDAITAGAPLVDRDTIRWWSDGWRVKRQVDRHARVLASRGLIESLFRTYVENIPNVRIDYGVAPVGLAFEGERVAGVRLGKASADRVTGVDATANGGADHARVADATGNGGADHARVADATGNGGVDHARVVDATGNGGADHARVADATLAADLVVDCSGRGSRLVPWLEAAGYPAPPITEIDVDLGYLVVTLERKRTDLDGATAMIVQNIAPTITRLGLAIAVEGDRWMVLLGGYFGDIAPSDRAGYLAFADSLPVPELGQLLRKGTPIGEPLPYRFRSSRRVHVERAARWPLGLVALGDATCSFNPLYGQGMSVALMQAEHLGAALDRHDSAARLARTIQRDLARITDLAWTIAAGGDLAYPQVIGERSAVGTLIGGYMSKVFRACSVDPEVAGAMFDVTNLVAPPSRLLRPATIARVLRAQRKWPGADSRGSQLAPRRTPAPVAGE